MRQATATNPVRMRTALVFAAPLLPWLVAAASFAAEPAQPQGSTLSVTVTGLHSTRGRLVACLWRDKAGFPSCARSGTARRVTVPVSGATMQLSFPGLARGRYAVTIEHDENADGKLGRNFIGMPTEGVGASNNPGGMPGFDKSLFEVNGDGAITVRMRYLFG